VDANAERSVHSATATTAIARMFRTGRDKTVNQVSAPHGGKSSRRLGLPRPYPSRRLRADRPPKPPNREKLRKDQRALCSTWSNRAMTNLGARRVPTRSRRDRAQRRPGSRLPGPLLLHVEQTLETSQPPTRPCFAENPQSPREQNPPRRKAQRRQTGPSRRPAQSLQFLQPYRGGGDRVACPPRRAGNKPIPTGCLF
jgi:hypothetical protein